MGRGGCSPVFSKSWVGVGSLVTRRQRNPPWTEGGWTLCVPEGKCPGLPEGQVLPPVLRPRVLHLEREQNSGDQAPA